MGDDSILKRFRSKKVLMVEELAGLLGASAVTARRRLKKWNTYTSINCNGRYYVLPEIPIFDGNGLWNYEIVFFSRHGNLRKTICELIKESEAGLSAQQISQLVGMRANSSFLSGFRDIPEVRREKQQGRFVYFFDKEAVYLRQKQRREELLSAKAPQLPSDADAVLILVDRIKHPGAPLNNVLIDYRKGPDILESGPSMPCSSIMGW